MMRMNTNNNNHLVIILLLLSLLVSLLHGQTVTVSVDKSTYKVGEYINFIYNNTAVNWATNDYITIIYQNATTSTSSTPNVKKLFIDKDSAGKKMASQFDVVNYWNGAYKALIFKAGTTIPAAISSGYTITSNPCTITTKGKTSFYIGDVLTVQYTSTVGVPFRFFDSIRIVWSNITNNDYAGAIGFYDENLYDDSGAATNEKNISLIDIPVGQYIAVLFLQDTVDPLAISNPFTIVQPTGNYTVTTNKVSYRVGATLTVKYTSPNGVSIRFFDYIRILSADITSNYGEGPYAIDQSLYEDATKGSKQIILTLPAGTYKAVLFLQDTSSVLAISTPFTVLANKCSMSTNRKSYTRGSTLVASYASAVSIPFRYYDYIRIIDSSVTDEYAGAMFYYNRNLVSASGKVRESIKIKVNMTAGSYKAIVFLQDTDIPLAISNTFRVR